MTPTTASEKISWMTLKDTPEIICKGIRCNCGREKQQMTDVSCRFDLTRFYHMDCAPLSSENSNALMPSTLIMGDLKISKQCVDVICPFLSGASLYLSFTLCFKCLSLNL